MKKIILTTISLVLLSGVVLAGFGVSPYLIRNYELYPGSFYEQEINLKRSEAELNLDLKAIVTIDALEIEDWITLYPGSEFILPVGQANVPMIVKINVPETAELKDYSGYIRANILSLEDHTGVAISLGSRIELDLKVIEAPEEIIDGFSMNLILILILILLLIIVLIIIKKKKKWN